MDKENLKTYLCAKRALRGQDTACLNEQLKGETKSDKPKISNQSKKEL